MFIPPWLNKHPDVLKVYYSPVNAQVIVLKTILKFTFNPLNP